MSDEQKPYDPQTQRKRLSISRVDLEAVLDLCDDVHIISMNVLPDPLWLDLSVSSPRFWRVHFGESARIMPMEMEHGRLSVGVNQGKNFNQMVQKDPEPTWMEGWRVAIEWLREQGGEIGEPIREQAQEFADEMETRLPEDQR